MFVFLKINLLLETSTTKPPGIIQFSVFAFIGLNDYSGDNFVLYALGIYANKVVTGSSDVMICLY